MGSINKIYNVNWWKVYPLGKSKIFDDDVICRVVIGEGDDYYSYKIEELMSEYNYNNIMSGKYHVKSFPYAKVPLLLFNEDKELISLVRGGNAPSYEDLNTYQREYIDSIINESSRKKYFRKI